jgi:short-subunit dehydrogenase
MAAAAAASRRSMGERWGLAGTTALVTGGSKGIGYIYTYSELPSMLCKGINVHLLS